MQVTMVRGNQTGVLQETIRENHKYRWVPCLALLDDSGRWLYTESWPLRSFNRAIQELESLGWVKQTDIES